ncbi:MAG: glycosyltransferase [Muribaculaceae bacterium]|nr:glycosyltransferase [Muribaculaceae bacterium]
MPGFSVIIPVYNRPQEVDDLLRSLLAQSCRDFEVIIVEDGSTVTCREQVDSAVKAGLDVRYFHKSNEGRSIARNYGLERAHGDYFVFFDSDCVIPPEYFATLCAELEREPVDCFGGPDAAAPDFTDLQKAISFSMTALLTTGGIRGGKVQMEKFVPRSFNMGYSRRVYEAVGGFREMFSEDIDMSTRVRQAGFSIRLIRPAFVYHKRRTSLAKFARQTHVFGMSRITLHLLYPGSLKLVHALPAVFTAGSVLLIILALAWRWWAILPLALYAVLLWLNALWDTRSLKISLMAVVTSFVQLWSYGAGFIRAWWWKIVLGHGRDINEEIEMRRGK